MQATTVRPHLLKSNAPGAARSTACFSRVAPARAHTSPRHSLLPTTTCNPGCRCPVHGDRLVACRFKAGEKEGEAQATAANEFANQQRNRLGRMRGTPATKSMGYAVLGPKQELERWCNNMGADLQPDEVDIRVTHNGVCHSDLHMRDDDWQLSKYPFIPGHEVVGIVQAVGAQVSGLEPGQRVGVGWIKEACRRCAACLRGEENVCVKGYTGLIVGGGHGGFQEVLRAPADFTYTIPEGLDSASAAPLLCAGVTVYSPLKRHITRPGMRVAVLGIGGLGHLAVQFAAALGGVVDALDVHRSKEAEARQLGASGFVVFTDDEEVKRRQGTYDVIINCASARIDTGKLLGLLSNSGALVQVGIPGGATMTLPLQDLVFGQKVVAGSIVGGRSDMNEMLVLAAAKGIKPLVETMPFNKVNEAMARVAQGKARYRIVLESEVEGREGEGTAKAAVGGGN